MFKHLILSSIYSDNISFEDGKEISGIPGGAGGYALAGAKVWTDEVLIISGVGEDYKGLFSNWFSKNRLSEDGLIIVDKNSYQNKIDYISTTERIETPKFGLDHRKKIELDTSVLEKFVSCNTKSVYTFQDASKVRLGPIIELKQNNDFSIMWEIANKSCQSQYLDLIRFYSRDIEMFSINYEESCQLFNERDPEKLAKSLQNLGFKLVLFRLGSKGVKVIMESSIVFVPSVKLGKVIDVTGCGNSSTAAAMISFMDGDDAITIGLKANIAAALTYNQYGPHPTIDKLIRNKMLKLIRSLESERKYIVYE